MRFRLSLILFFASLLSLGSSRPLPLEVDSLAPNFSLQDIETGQKFELSGYRGQFVVLEWVNPQCPFVQRHYRSKFLPEMQRHLKEEGALWFSIYSKNPGGLSDSELLEFWKGAQGEATAFLVDMGGEVGRSYRARTTPQIFLIDREGRVIYQGAICSDPNNPQQARNYLEEAFSEAVKGRAVSVSKTTPYGCLIKY